MRLASTSISTVFVGGGAKKKNFALRAQDILASPLGVGRVIRPFSKSRLELNLKKLNLSEILPVNCKLSVILPHDKTQS